MWLGWGRHLTCQNRLMSHGSPSAMGPSLLKEHLFLLPFHHRSSKLFCEICLLDCFSCLLSKTTRLLFHYLPKFGESSANPGEEKKGVLGVNVALWQSLLLGVFLKRNPACASSCRPPWQSSLDTIQDRLCLPCLQILRPQMLLDAALSD